MNHTFSRSSHIVTHSFSHPLAIPTSTFDFQFTLRTAQQSSNCPQDILGTCTFWITILWARYRYCIVESSRLTCIYASWWPKMHCSDRSYDVMCRTRCGSGQTGVGLGPSMGTDLASVGWSAAPTQPSHPVFG